MYLLASAFFVASLYSFYVGDISNARIVLGVAVVLAGARLLLWASEYSFLSSQWPTPFARFLDD
jgi:drug/metabolite transporter (DMT)-like permease